MAKLVENSVKRTIFMMAFPMLTGTFAMNAYHLCDTWFVSRLGTQALAAMSFTFPVVMLLQFVARGLGTGSMTLISHALGQRDKNKASMLTSHAFLLAVFLVIALSVFGIVSIEPLFRMLGAGEEILPLIKDYMFIWYSGLIFMVIPAMSGDIIISAGDSKAASFLMVSGSVINAVLDPVFIFGFMGVPAMGISGAALATVIGRFFTFVAALYILHYRHRLISFANVGKTVILNSWKKILHISVPSILSLMLVPFSQGVITRIIAGFGVAAVAAAGTAGRIELFAFMIPMTVGMSLIPFVSQNYGAKRMDRIKEASVVTIVFALAYGFFISIVFYASAPYLAGLFSSDPEVIKVLIKYIRIISFGYGFMEVHRYSGFYLIGVHKPVSAAMLNISRVLVFLIPLSFLGAHFFGITGVFTGRLITDIVSGSVGILCTFIVLRSFKLSDPKTGKQVSNFIQTNI